MKIHDDNGNIVDVKRSPVLDYVMKRLTEKCPDFMVWLSDFEWLNELNRVHGKKKITNESLVEAVKESLPIYEDYFAKACKFTALYDPWELLIESDICDTNCKPL